MSNLEILQKALDLLCDIVKLEKERGWGDSSSRQLSPSAMEKLEEFQNISIRVEKILDHLDVYTVINMGGRTANVIKQSANDGDLMMVNLAIPLIRQAKGFLSDPGQLGESLKFNSGIDDDVQSRFMTGDYSGAVAKAFKIFKSKLYQHTETDDVSAAIGKLKQKWEENNDISSETRSNFESGISHLLNSLSRFRNVEFHSEDWLVEEKQEAFYFISMISMCLDMLDKYLSTNTT